MITPRYETMDEIEAAEAAEHEAERDPFVVLQEAASELREARGVLERYRRRTDDALVRLAEVEKEFGDARDRVYRAIEELMP